MLEWLVSFCNLVEPDFSVHKHLLPPQNSSTMTLGRGRNHKRRTSLDDPGDVIKDGIEIFKGGGIPSFDFLGSGAAYVSNCQTTSWYGLLTWIILRLGVIIDVIDLAVARGDDELDLAERGESNFDKIEKLCPIRLCGGL